MTNIKGTCRNSFGKAPGQRKRPRHSSPSLCPYWTFGDRKLVKSNVKVKSRESMVYVVITGSALERRRIVIQGIVQGVGFRPFVYGQALQWGLVGFVLNDSGGVTIEVEGTSELLDGFQRALRE